MLVRSTLTCFEKLHLQIHQRKQWATPKITVARIHQDEMIFSIID